MGTTHSRRNKKRPRAQKNVDGRQKLLTCDPLGHTLPGMEHEQRRQANREAIGANIASQRALRRLKSEDVADALGIHRSTFSGYERGRSSIACEMLIDIAAELRCPVDRLIGVSTGAS